MPDLAKIKFKNNSFWTPDRFIEILSEYICNTFEDVGLNNYSTTMRKLYENCHFNRNGGSTGMVNINLEKYIGTFEDKRTFISILSQTQERIRSLGSEISVTELNAFEHRKIDESFVNPWYIPVQTQSLITLVGMMKDLLNEALIKNNELIMFKGFQNDDSSSI